MLVALAVPVLHIHTADSGVDGLPRSLEIMQTYDRMQAAFPGETFSAGVVIEGENLDIAQVRDAAQEMRQIGARVGSVPGARHGRREPGRQVAVVEVPLAGTGTDDALDRTAVELAARRRRAATCSTTCRAPRSSA